MSGVVFTTKTVFLRTSVERKHVTATMGKPSKRRTEPQNLGASENSEPNQREMETGPGARQRVGACGEHVEPQEGLVAVTTVGSRAPHIGPAIPLLVFAQQT